MLSLIAVAMVLSVKRTQSLRNIQAKKWLRLRDDVSRGELVVYRNDTFWKIYVLASIR
jgi:hypothetical protein